MNQSRAPLAMIATTNIGRPAQQNGKDHENIAADTIANEIPGGKVLVLSPIEGINREEQAAGIGYIDRMKQNVANLKEA
jgi:hypothetical protein